VHLEVILRMLKLLKLS